MPAKARTSQTHPLHIATIDLPGLAGKIGITLCPGKKDNKSLTGIWDRDIATDVAAIKKWDAAVVVCLMESFELAMLKVSSQLHEEKLSKRLV